MNPVRWVQTILTVILACQLEAEDLAPFYLIEPSPSGILLHFDTTPFKRYQLQATTNLVVRPPGKTQWLTLYTVPATPFGSHFIVLDPSTNSPSKCYRILVN